jgi:hypothetical protein
VTVIMIDGIEVADQCYGGRRGRIGDHDQHRFRLGTDQVDRMWWFSVLTTDIRAPFPGWMRWIRMMGADRRNLVRWSWHPAAVAPSVHCVSIVVPDAALGAKDQCEHKPVVAVHSNTLCSLIDKPCLWGRLWRHKAPM